ncbi:MULTISPECIES: zinc ribbon domain-containing protein [Clostridium]|uniref:Zinc ribbon domain-containing protein n=1 Tax=Clostridium frigoriphilum TaxID=443253 RepID=A0ABU7UHB5_9CLOT|nr:zinc ribbon domain-containing protein [Clostridium sp. DSM 17811]MBU3098272.1 zinc ribbon domain-containing protein [Clostridium sp. DSM 17811]
MSFSSRSSRSSRGNHYRNGNNGSNHYKKKGIFGKLFEGIGSRSSSNRNYNNNNNYENQNQYSNNNDLPLHTNQTPNQNAINCSKCNSPIPAGSKFCLQCGEKVMEVLFCKNCGEKLPPNAKFCLKCGKAINS